MHTDASRAQTAARQRSSKRARVRAATHVRECTGPQMYARARALKATCVERERQPRISLARAAAVEQVGD